PLGQLTAAQGITFALQASPDGAGALGAAGGGLGYGGISPSVAIKFDLYSQGSHNSTTGLYINGATGATGQINMMPGINFLQNHTYQVDLSYDGFTLSERVKDLASGSVFTTSYTITLRDVLGADTAYAGFTGGTGGETAWIAIESWTANFNPVAAPPHLEIQNVTPRAPRAG